MIDEPQLKMMKKNAILLNAARGKYPFFRVPMQRNHEQLTQITRFASSVMLFFRY
jgi:hypothetical protein